MYNFNNSLKEWLSDPNIINLHLPDFVYIENFHEGGGQGIVFKGLVNDSPAAIKVYFPGGQLHQRIVREILALKTLNCPNIVDLLWHSQIEINGNLLPIVATSFVFGQTLKTLISENSLSSAQIGTLGYDVTNAIKYMWAKRIVHRDIKPSNIICKDDGRFCVIDLGIARHIDQTNLTSGIIAWGTLGYMSPEQFSAVKQLTCKSDLYALGILMIECAVGSHPTFYDQLRLLSINYNLESNLPQEAKNCDFSDLICRLLHQRPTFRPKPGTVLETLRSYS